MKHINSIRDFEQVNFIPYSIVIYSSIKSCHPCRLLKKWMEEEYPTLENVFYIDVHHPKLNELTEEIYALPTVDLLQDGIQIKRTEGFNKPEIESMIKYLIEPQELQEQVTPLIIDTEVQESVFEPKDSSTPNRSVDEIIDSISKHLNQFPDLK